MKIKNLLIPNHENDYTPQLLQKVAMLAMTLMVLLSFAISNLQSLLWQSSEWLVSTVLPAVVINLTNEEREEVATNPLKRSVVLDEAARLKAEHMAKNQYFSHFSPDGTSPWYWFKQVSYNFSHAGENLAIHFNDSSVVVDAWMNSPTHRANILNANYTEIGVGTAKGEYQGYETVYVVQLFGTPAKNIPPRPISVKNETTPLALADTAQVEQENRTGNSQRAPETVKETDIESDSESTTEILGAEFQDQNGPEGKQVVVNGVSESENTNHPTLDKEKPEETALIETFASTTFSSYMATSSGLEPQNSSGNLNESTIDVSPLASIATKPSVFLQMSYLALGLFVASLLIFSILIGVRNHRPLQVLYGVGLLIIMSGLFYVHVELSTGVVIASELPLEDV